MKSIPSEDYVVRKIRTHKTQTYSYSFLADNNPEQISIDIAIQPPANWAFIASSEPINLDNIYQRPLYSSILNILYNTSSLYSLGYIFRPTDAQFYVLNVAEQAYGENIQPNSFQIFSSATPNILTDDGQGNIFVSGTTNCVGTINYSLGIAAIKYDSSSMGGIITSNGLSLITGSNLNVQFQATLTIYEYEIVCTMDSGEMNFSSNPSFLSPSSSQGTQIKVADLFASGSLTPYITTIGVYTAAGELVAIGKVPYPIRRAVNSQQTFVIRFDN